MSDSTSGSFTNSITSTSEIILGKNDKGFNFLMFIIVVIIFFIIVIPWDKLGSKKFEEMSGGTVAQMFAQDSQDVYLKGNVDKIATGNATLMFNQPTRQLNTFQNRGQPLYSILLPDTPMNPTANMLEVSNNYVDNIINNEVYKKENKLTFSNPVLTLDNVLPKQAKTKAYEATNNNNKDEEQRKSSKSTKSIKLPKSVPTIPKNVLPSSLPIDLVANSNPYELAKVAKQVAKTKQTSDNLPPLTKWTDENKLFQLYTEKAINDKKCLLDPASCTGFSGGARLSDGFVQSTKSVPYVNLDGNYYYTDSYLGSYYNDNFNGLNIMKPYPFIPDSNKV
jgi:hypothetical protein